MLVFGPLPSRSFATALDTLLESIWVHRRQNVNVGVSQQILDTCALVRIVKQVRNQMDHQLAAHCLVAVHVGHVLDIWLEPLIVAFALKKHTFKLDTKPLGNVLYLLGQSNDPKLSVFH